MALLIRIYLSPAFAYVHVMNKMGTGHTKHKQTSFFKTNWKYHYSYGGILRNKREGRKARPLSSREPVHLVFKLDSSRLRRRSQFQHFFRVVAGQIAQRFKKEGLIANLVTGTQSLWKHRPFTRVIRGWRAYKIVRDYIQLNEQEVQGKIRYQKRRLRGLSSSDWQILWT